MTGSYVPITAFGSLGGSAHTSHDALMGGRTPITTEAFEAYNNLRRFLGLDAVELEMVGRWAFAEGLTNNANAWGQDTSGVGLWYAMQGAKVGWIADEAYEPQLIAELQRTARLGDSEAVVKLARRVDRPGFIEHLETTGGLDAFINTLKMEPHHGGWMHSRAHGWLEIEGGAIAHDINHLTVLSHDQSQPFMNDTFDWPQWPALTVPDAVVIDYFQSIVTLSDPTGASPDDKRPTPNPIPTPDPTPTPQPTPDPDPEPQPDPDPQPVPDPAPQPDASLTVAVDGQLWWNGFTAEITLTNTSSRNLDNWSWSFESPHTISGDPWGAQLSSSQTSDGFYRHTLTGMDWARSIPAGASISVGFNGNQGAPIGNSGSLNAELLFTNTDPIPPTPNPIPTPDPTPTPQPTPDPAPDPAPTPDPDPEPQPDPDPQPVPDPAPQPDASLTVAVDGQLWWNGFTAEITLTNTSSRNLDNWSWSFESPHTISGDPWGAQLSSSQTSDGFYRHTLTGMDWARSIPAGASISVGFNGNQGAPIGNSGSLNAELLFTNTDPIPPTPNPIPTPDPTPTPQPTPDPAPDPAPTPDPDPEPQPDPDPQPVPDPQPDPLDTRSYSSALGLSLLFYEANRSGDLDEARNRVPWRGDSGLSDGRDGIYFGDATAANLQADLSLDLSGGYHDAGDHVKFGLPLASSLSSLAWGGISFPDGYSEAGEMDALLDAVRWGTDYLLKAQGLDQSGATTFFIAQVGDGHSDHALWSAPEVQTIPRPAMAVTPDKPGSDVSAASAAALASASVLFRQQGDQLYADTLLERAESLFTFADRYRGKYSDSITGVQNFYNSWSGYNDELAYGAAWLARAMEASGADGSGYLSMAQDTYHQSIGGLNNGWTHNWDDASYATAVLLAEDARDPKALDDVRNWLDSWVDGRDGVTITAGGLRFISPWGSLRYAANTAMLAGVVADTLIDPNGRYSALAREGIDYILGANPRQASYVVGYGDNSPQQPHHRAASGVGWADFNADQPNRHELNGALVGGPSAADDFAYTDARSDYISNEVAIDYNAGFTSALAYLNQL